MLKVKFVKHQNITDNELQAVIQIKSIAWPYSWQKQIEWIEKNIDKNDIHVMLYNVEDECVAYANLINVNVWINDKVLSALGIGNVCAKERGKGYGKKLMSRIRQYIDQKNAVAILFCRDGLLNFYRKIGWTLVPSQNVICKPLDLSIVHVMVINFVTKINQLIYKGKIF